MSKPDIAIRLHRAANTDSRYEPLLREAAREIDRLRALTNRGKTITSSHPIAREIEAAHAHLISSHPYLARAFEAARESSHTSAGQLDSLWRQVDGLIEALRALAVFVEYDGHVAPGDEQVEMPL